MVLLISIFEAFDILSANYSLSDRPIGNKKTNFYIDFRRFIMKMTSSFIIKFCI